MAFRQAPGPETPDPAQHANIGVRLQGAPLQPEVPRAAETVQDHARATPHLTAPAVVEPMLRALAAGLAREEGPAAARDSAVEQFARMVDAATASLERR